MGIGVPGDPKVNFWVSVGYRSGYRSGECLGPGNFDNRTRAVQEHASTTFDAAGSAETFFVLLCTTHAYNRTHVYYSSIRLRYRFWEFTVSVSMLSRHKHQHRPHMKGFLHEPFCLWLLIYIYIYVYWIPRAPQKHIKKQRTSNERPSPLVPNESNDRNVGGKRQTYRIPGGF